MTILIIVIILMQMNSMFAKISVIIRPTNDCNMRCRHCYHSVSNYNKERMEIDVFENIMKKLTATYKEINLIWHGGEPLLMGIDFYKHCYQIINKYKEDGIVFKNSLQTNGVLITEDFIDFFKLNNIGLSLSYDGKWNDVLRHNTNIIEEKIELMRKKNLKFNCITTISNVLVDEDNSLIDLYEYFKDKNINMKFNRLFQVGEALNNSFSVNINKYISETKKLFEYWCYDDNATIDVSNLRHLLNIVTKNNHKECSNSSCLFSWMDFDYKGNIYPCARLSQDDFVLGNIKNVDDIRNIFLSSKYIDIYNKNIERKNKCKKNCNLYELCQSGCNANAFIEGKIESQSIFDCTYFKELVNFVFEFLCKNKDNIKNKYVIQQLKDFDIMSRKEKILCSI